MNTQRVDVAARALESMPDFEEGGLVEAFTDLLANLMHFCEAYGIDFEGCLGMARIHFDAEK
jgi:hypothetical protein